MSSPSGFDTAVRGGVMLCILGGAVWGASQYPPICDRAMLLLKRWESGTLLRPNHDGLEQARNEGSDAPVFSADATPESQWSLPPQTLATDEASRPLPPPKRPLPEEMRETPLPAPGGLYPARQVEFQRDAEPAHNEFRANPRAEPGAMADLDARLSRLGATYCLLERWEENPTRYRFHCRVRLAVGVEPRRFEATGSDPIRLMQEVADAVSACRAQRAP